MDFLWAGAAAAQWLPLVSRPRFLWTSCFAFAFLFMSSLLSSSEALRKRSWAPTFGLPKHSPPRLNEAYNEKKRKVNMGTAFTWSRCGGKHRRSSRGSDFVWGFFFLFFSLLTKHSV